MQSGRNKNVKTKENDITIIPKRDRGRWREVFNHRVLTGKTSEF